MSIVNFYEPTNTLIISIIIGYIVIYQCYSGRLQFKNIPFIERIGKFTYGLYLYHSICIFITHVLILDIFKLNESVLIIVFIIPVISLVLSLLLSVISYKYYESFFLKLKNKYGY